MLTSISQFSIVLNLSGPSYPTVALLSLTTMAFRRVLAREQQSISFSLKKHVSLFVFRLGRR
jgi:hypothetical protein